MAKFGKLIDTNLPVLLGFYNRSDGNLLQLDATFEDIMQELEGQVKIYKIDAGENPDLIKALQVKEFPSFVIYNRGKMVWRNNRTMNGRGLIQALEHFL